MSNKQFTQFAEVKAAVDENYQAFEAAAIQQNKEQKPKIRAIWKVARPILLFVSTFPLIPGKWRSIIKSLVFSIDLLSNQEQQVEELQSESAARAISLSRVPTLLEEIQTANPQALSVGLNAHELLEKSGQTPLTGTTEAPPQLFPNLAEAAPAVEPLTLPGTPKKAPGAAPAVQPLTKDTASAQTAATEPQQSAPAITVQKTRKGRKSTKKS
jgi:hypothetical protein